MITMAFATTTAEVAAALRLSKNTLIRLRSSDVLRPAIHYINVGQGEQRACLRWDLDKVEETLARRSKSLPRSRKMSPLRSGADGTYS
jgi:hypothetical protein